MIAMTLSLSPKRIIADEPTRPLDATVQAQVLDLLLRLQQESGTALILITHDLGVVADIADDVNVMCAGRAAEQIGKHDTFYQPHHPYTKGLLESIPSGSATPGRLRPITGQPPSPDQAAPGLLLPPEVHLCNGPLPGRGAETVCRWRRRLPSLCMVPARQACRPGRGKRKPRNSAISAGQRRRWPRPSRPAGRPRERDRMSSIRPPDARAARLGEPDIEDDVLVRLENLVKYFPVRAGVLISRAVDHVQAVYGVSLTIRLGQTLGLVGETGCGKSALARSIAWLIPVTSGKVTFEGRDITNLSRKKMRPVRREIQMTFQDPYGSLNPWRRVGAIIGDPFVIHKTATAAERRRAVQGLMERVGLNPELYNRFPAEFSGGQRQRIGVACALALRPKLIICDELVSALDLAIQAQFLNLLRNLQDEFGLSYLFSAHNLEVVRHVSNSVNMMYLGKIAEGGPTGAVYETPVTPIQRPLLSAARSPTPSPLPPASGSSSPGSSRRRWTPQVAAGSIPDALRQRNSAASRSHAWRASQATRALT
jgi:peptide/nickel transport system ATP-binding protein